MSGDLQIPTVSADVAADIAKYTNKVTIFPWNRVIKNGLLKLLLCHPFLGLQVVNAGITSLLFVQTLQIMDTIKGTMTEIYNDLSKSTSGNTITEVIPNFRPAHF